MSTLANCTVYHTFSLMNFITELPELVSNTAVRLDSADCLSFGWIALAGRGPTKMRERNRLPVPYKSIDPIILVLLQYIYLNTVLKVDS